MITEKTEKEFLKEHILTMISVLDQMIGHHRNLLECCREEKTALAEANLKDIQSKTQTKEFLIENIRGLDKARAETAGDIIYSLSGNEKPLSLSQIILQVEPDFLEESLKLRSQMTTLIHLVGSIQKINDQNRDFLKQSVTHIEEMKKNVLGEASPKTETYGNKGSVQSGKNQNSRLISKEV